MKKIFSEKTFDFKINAALTVKLSPEGVIVEDDVARNIVSRLATIVTVMDVESESVELEVTPEPTIPVNEPIVETPGEETPVVEETPEVKEDTVPVEETPEVEESITEENADVVPSEEAPTPRRGRGANKNK